jgi:hypothetical protein
VSVLQDDVRETQARIIEYLQRRPDKTASFEEILQEPTISYRSPHPRPIPTIVSALRGLIMDGTLETFQADFNGRFQNHFKLIR